ncbi:MAG TPA: hypothetical protein VD866_09225 [Urbifossiella sp.]|nr:hypothetical protein [Urbifossiella sp.]
MPAGNVTAALSGGTLEVLGDATDNRVVLRGHGAGIVEVQGIGTTVNGGAGRATFAGVGRVRVLAADGDDRVTTKRLVLSDLYVSGGTGNDVLRLEDTTDAGSGLAIALFGDEPAPSGVQTNGSDTILVTGTDVRSGEANVFVRGDYSFADGSGGRDQITLADTRIEADRFDLFVLAGGGANDLGDAVTVERLTATVAGESLSPFLLIVGSDGADTVRLRDVDLTFDSATDVFVDFGIGTGEGEDVIDAARVSIEAISGTDEAGFGYFNQAGLNLIADTVRLTDSRVIGGATVNVPFFGVGYTSGFVSVTGTVVDVRNVVLPGNGAAALSLQSMEAFDGVERADVWSLTNVRVTSVTGELGDVVLDSYGGNDTIRVRNSSFETVIVYLGEGDDSLTMVNTTGAAPFAAVGFGGIDAGGGDDQVTLVDCTFIGLPIDLGGGDDVLRLRGNMFESVELFGGTDRLDRHGDLGQITIDGFEY